MDYTKSLIANNYPLSLAKIINEYAILIVVCKCRKNNVSSHSNTQLCEKCIDMDPTFFFREEWNKCSNKNIQLMVDIVDNKHKISLRMLEEFIKKNMKKIKISYTTTSNGDILLFNPMNTYVARLDIYGRIGFDLFKRGQSDNFSYTSNNITKTIKIGKCQLRFFQWLFKY